MQNRYVRDNYMIDDLIHDIVCYLIMTVINP